jgi:protein phosphatase 2C family protein 2/3
MSSFRSKPVLVKHSFESETSQYHIAVSSMRGWRVTMEDAHLIDVDFDGPPTTTGIFGVFDGHGGHDVSLHASRGMSSWIRGNRQFPNSASMEDVLKHAFITCDDELRYMSEFDARVQGSTACVVVISPTEIHCANVGDSRAVLYSNGQVTALSEDHKTSVPREAERLRKAGVPVINDRVCGSLAMSRAFGDFIVKGPDGCNPATTGVTPLPDVVTVRRQPDLDDFIVIACDGIWDCLSNEEVCMFISEELQVHDDGALICENLCTACVASRVTAPVGTDNMTAILIRFKRQSDGSVDT